MKVYMGVGDECYAHFEDIDTIIFDFESQFSSRIVFILTFSKYFKCLLFHRIFMTTVILIFLWRVIKFTINTGLCIILSKGPK